MPHSLPILTAPTAAGKTALALRLAQEFSLEIVAADAFTVYRGLDIGTAKPTAQEQQEVRHHLIDVADVTEHVDVARWLTLAEEALEDVLSRGRIPLVVGGTGFYLNALLKGLPLTPPSERGTRAAIEAELQERGLNALLAEIERDNPTEAARMERNPRRVVRALEVKRQTGQWPSAFGRRAPRFAFTVHAYAPEPQQHAQASAERVAQMLSAGLLTEAKWLAEQVSPDLRPRPTVWQGIGYPQAHEVNAGRCDLAAAQAAIEVATRQYAKRQLTFMRGALGAQVGSRQEAEATLRATLRS